MTTKDKKPTGQTKPVMIPLSKLHPFPEHPYKVQDNEEMDRLVEMETLTAPLLCELIDHIDVYETEGTGKNRTQRITICYRFVGYLEVPVPDDILLALDMRRGVRVNYTSKAV